MKKQILVFWRVIWIVIFLGLMVINFLWPNSLVAKIASCIAISLNAVYAILYSRNERLLWLALILTFLADVALAFNSSIYLGVLIFVFVQFSHFARLAKLKLHHFLLFLAIFTVMIGICFTLNLEIIFVMGAFYACLLCANFIISLRWYRRSHGALAQRSMLGFMLFILCDSCVAISYCSRISLLPLKIYPFADYCSWIFYYPSQVLITNSGHKSHN